MPAVETEAQATLGDARAERPEARPKTTHAATPGWLRGARLSWPFLPGVVIFGLAFGALARETLSLGEAVLMSALVNGGASQLLALSLWEHPAPVGAIILGAALINARHLLMGAAIQPWAARLPPAQRYLGLFFLTNSVWALCVREHARGRGAEGFLLGSGVVTLGAWTGATALGYALGALVADPRPLGLDFFIAISLSAFLGLLCGGAREIPPWLAAGALAIGLQALGVGWWGVLIAALAASLLGAARDVR